MNHSLKAFIISASLYTTLFGAVIFYKPAKEEKKKIVVIDMNMISTIVQTKKIEEAKEKINTKEEKKIIEEKKEVEKKIEKKVVKKLTKKQPEKKKQKKIEKEHLEKPKKQNQKKIDESIKRVKSGESWQECYIRTNLSKIIAAIKKYKKYPYMAKKDRIEGEVIIKCVITPQGGVKNIRFVKKSSSSILNENSIDILKKASKEFEAPMKEMELIIPFNYDLVM